jgi:hypothetical protein
MRKKKVSATVTVIAYTTDVQELKQMSKHEHTHNVLSSSLLCHKTYLVVPGMDNHQTKTHSWTLSKPNGPQTHNLDFEG